MGPPKTSFAPLENLCRAHFCLIPLNEMRSWRLWISSEEPGQEGGGWERTCPSHWSEGKEDEPWAKEPYCAVEKVTEDADRAWRFRLAWVGVARRPSSIQAEVEWLLGKADSDVYR